MCKSFSIVSISTLLYLSVCLSTCLPACVLCSTWITGSSYYCWLTDSLLVFSLCVRKRRKGRVPFSHLFPFSLFSSFPSLTYSQKEGISTLNLLCLEEEGEGEERRGRVIELKGCGKGMQRAKKTRYFSLTHNAGTFTDIRRISSSSSSFSFSFLFSSSITPPCLMCVRLKKRKGEGGEEEEEEWMKTKPKCLVCSLSLSHTHTHTHTYTHTLTLSPFFFFPLFGYVRRQRVVSLFPSPSLLFSLPLFLFV